MKHLLIILISILLLSSPLFGDNHKGETLYLWKTSSGELWKGFGEKGTHPIYKGDVENGKPNGQGTYTWSDGDKYVGEFKNGKKHGPGTWTSTDGDKYSGEWKKNELWNGTMYDKDGNIIKRVVNGVKQ